MSIREIVFLDFDGVLNNPSTPLPPQISMYGGSSGLSFPPMDPANIAAANRIVEARPNAEFVLSTAWRETFSVGTLADLLKEAGFKGKVIDKTPKDTAGVGYFRGMEIEQWLDANVPDWREGAARVVVLDDNPDDLYGLDLPDSKLFSFKPLEHLLVDTDEKVGMTETEADKAIAMLGATRGA